MSPINLEFTKKNKFKDQNRAGLGHPKIFDPKFNPMETLKNHAETRLFPQLEEEAVFQSGSESPPHHKPLLDSQIFFGLLN